MVSLSKFMSDLRCFVPFFLQVQVMMSVSWSVLGEVCSRLCPVLRIGSSLLNSRALTSCPSISDSVVRSTR